MKRWDGTAVAVFPMPEPPGSIALRARGGLLVALQSGVYLLGPESPQLLARPPEHERGLRFNDGRCDRAGRFWVGTLREPDFPPEGILYRIGADGTAKSMRRNLRVPNSLAFSPDGRTMYLADSPRHKIWAFDYHAGAGELSNERVFATPHPGNPDGSCVDADGCLWNAEWGAARVVRYTPAGKVDRVIDVPAKNPTCCCFGDARLDTLFVTSADGGGVFSLRPGCTGLAEARYSG